jgi:hypothetical protein
LKHGSSKKAAITEKIKPGGICFGRSENVKKKRNNNQNKQIAIIEHHLRQYKHYQAGIKNLRRQLDHILPNMTASYELSEGSRGVFVISSSTEKAALDRIESKRAMDINEKINEYNLICSSIDMAIKELDPKQQRFIQLRYMQGKSIEETAAAMTYTTKNLYKIRQHTMERLLISLWNILTL